MWLLVALPVSLLMVVVGAHFGFMLCHDHPAAFLMGLALARYSYLGFQDLQILLDEKIDEPPAKHYELTELEAVATLKQVLTYTSLGDKWWHIRDLNLDDGRILASVILEEDYHRHTDLNFSKERVQGKMQIVLIITVTPKQPGVAVNQRYIVSATNGRLPATQAVKTLQDSFDEALSARSRNKKGIVGVAA